MTKATTLILKHVLILAFLLTSFAQGESCQNIQLQATNEKYQDILGCWKGCPVGRLADRNEQLRLITLKPDGNPAITLIYELDPRSRVWEYDIASQSTVFYWYSQPGDRLKPKMLIKITKTLLSLL